MSDDWHRRWPKFTTYDMYLGSKCRSYTAYYNTTAQTALYCLKKKKSYALWAQAYDDMCSGIALKKHAERKCQHAHTEAATCFHLYAYIHIHTCIHVFPLSTWHTTQTTQQCWYYERVRIGTAASLFQPNTNPPPTTKLSHCDKLAGIFIILAILIGPLP